MSIVPYPTSSQTIYRMLGEPSGARGWMNGSQSGVASRMSRATFPFHGLVITFSVDLNGLTLSRGNKYSPESRRMRAGGLFHSGVNRTRGSSSITGSPGRLGLDPVHGRPYPLPPRLPVPEFEHCTTVRLHLYGRFRRWIEWTAVLTRSYGGPGGTCAGREEVTGGQNIRGGRRGLTPGMGATFNLFFQSAGRGAHLYALPREIEEPVAC